MKKLLYFILLLSSSCYSQITSLDTTLTIYSGDTLKYLPFYDFTARNDTFIDVGLNYNISIYDYAPEDFNMILETTGSENLDSCKIILYKDTMFTIRFLISELNKKGFEISKLQQNEQNLIRDNNYQYAKIFALSNEIRSLKEQICIYEQFRQKIGKIIYSTYNNNSKKSVNLPKKQIPKTSKNINLNPKKPCQKVPQKRKPTK